MKIDSVAREKRFPVGREVTLEELERDPYPVFERLRRYEPISWIADLNMWYVVGYEDLRTALSNTSTLTTESAQSTILDTFGTHILTTEGATHERYRQALRHPFMPAFIRTHLEAAIAAAAAALIDEIENQGQADMRLSFASRLPIQALDENSLLARLVQAPANQRLSDDEIKRNLSIVFFGGISTVEALLLNCLWALFEHPDVLQCVQSDLALLPQIIEETMRWLSPVQSATRYVITPFEWEGIEFASHDTVNCMLGAANRDPSVFTDPDRFDLDRTNTRRHLGFATGTHACLGSHLAKAEVRIGLEVVLGRLRDLRLERALTQPASGYEFRQSRKLTLCWDANC